MAERRRTETANQTPHSLADREVAVQTFLFQVQRAQADHQYKATLAEMDEVLMLQAVVAVVLAEKAQTH